MEYFYEKLVTKAAENVNFSVKNGKFYAEYPATAGFKYGINAAEKGKYDALGESSVLAPKFISNYKEDYKAEETKTVPSSGEFEIFLTVGSVSDLYKPVVLKIGSETVKDIGEASSISNVSAKYVAKKSVIVSWKPATLTATGKNSPVSNFKVYRSSDADSSWTAISSEVKEGQAVDSTSAGPAAVSEGYYITDTVEDDSIGYKYYVVHTDGTYYGSSYGQASLSGVTAAKTDEPTLTVSKFVGNTSGAYTVKISSTKANEKQTLALSYVKLAEDAKDKVLEYILSDFTALELSNNNGYADSYINYIEKAAAGTYLVKLTASEEGKKDSSVYKIVIVSDAAVNTSSLSLSSDLTKVTVTEGIAKDSKTDSVANYTYTLYKVVSTTSKDYSDSVTVVTTPLGSVALAYPAGVTAYCTKDIEDVKSTESNVTTLYYVVKALASDPSVFAKVSE